MKLLLLVFAMALSASTQEQKITVSWYPVLSVENGKTSEGLYIFFKNIHGQPTVAIEASANGKDLPRATGIPDGRTSFLPAPIRDLNTYKIKSMSITINGATWIERDPLQTFELGVNEASVVTGLTTTEHQ